LRNSGLDPYGEYDRSRPRPHPLIPLTFFAVDLILCSAAVLVVWLVAR
jgi:hypothetical protein